MFPTPDLSHATHADYDEVYEPAEDSFLLMDALEKDVVFLTSIKPLICLEVGCGSGAVSAFMANVLGPCTVYFCTDMNAAATQLTARTGQQNNTSLQPVCCDLVGPLRTRLHHAVDVLLFNPPYVETSAQQVGSGQLEASWAGGLKGRQVMDRLFVHVASLLTERGVFYVLIVKDNDPDDVKEFCENVGLEVETVLERRAGNERLAVLRCTRSQTTTPT